MPDFVTSRGDIITAICVHLLKTVPEFALVKPYQGELDRYNKRAQINSDIFPAQVQLQTPFALVISKDRENADKNGGGGGGTLKLRHMISIYVGAQTSYDFGSTEIPGIYDLLTKSAQALHGRTLVANGGALNLVSDGEYLITTDLFTVYDQKFFRLEIGF